MIDTTRAAKAQPSVAQTQPGRTSGEIQFSGNRIVSLLGGMYASAFDALKQIVDNAVDAGASLIWLVLEPGKITVVDNGHGMAPYIRTDARRAIEKYYDELVEARKRGEKFLHDLRERVPAEDLKTLEWMATHVGYSSKRPDFTDPKIGSKGVGWLAWLTYGVQAFVTTRPDEEFARAYYGPHMRTIPVWRLITATKERITDENEASYTIEPFDGPFLDPFGNPLESGTVVVVTTSRMNDNFKPEVLNRDLRREYGQHLRAHKFDLAIVDRITPAGRQGRGRIINVEAPTWRGYEIANEFAELPTGEQYRVEIVYNPDSRKDTVDLRRPSSDRACSIVDIPELNVDPLNSGKLSGSIWFPNFPGVDPLALWNAPKNRPSPTPQLDAWVRSVQNDLVPRLKQRIEENQIQNAKAKDTALANALGEAMLRALQDDEVLRSLVVPPRVTITDPPPPTLPKVGIPIVQATVRNENRRPVKGILIELWQGGALKLRRETNSSGRVSFGQQPHGRRYQIRFGQLPDGVERTSPAATSEFALSERQPDYEATLYVKNNEPALPPPPPRLSSLNIQIVELDDPEEPWQQRIAFNGTLWINKIGHAYRRLVQAGREEDMLHLVAAYGAAAFVEFGQQRLGRSGEPHEILIMISNLIPKVHQHLRDTMETRERRKSASRK